MAKSNFHTLVDALFAAPRQRPFITMWHDEDDVHEVTFGEFIRLASSEAAEFRARGLKPGERVILIMPQGIPLMVSFAAAMLGGAAPAILAYPNFKAEPGKYSSGLSGVTENLKASLVVIDEEFPAELMCHLKMPAGTQLLRSRPLALRDGGGESQVTFANAASEFSPPEMCRKPSTLAFIQHSAGTTGLQKGVALSHEAVLTQLGHLAASLEIDEDDVIYSWLPLYHDMGLIACFMLPLAFHLRVVMQSPLEWVMRPGTMLQIITDYRCTLAWVPNFAFQFLARRVRSEERNGYNLASLRALINCSEPVRARSMDEFEAAYARCHLRPTALQSSYAMAENVFAVTQSDGKEPPRRLWVDAKQLLERRMAVQVAAGSQGSLCLVSSGRCLTGNEVRIISPEGTDLPDGEIGEILIRSDSLFSGYYNRPDLTAKAFVDGWYLSGDLGLYLDGELYVIGRKKDLIITAGKNIYPQDIEEIVSSHPAIHDGRVVAFGLYNPDLGTEDIIVVAETEREKDLENAIEIERALRNAIAAELDIAVRAVCLKPPRWIVKSTAGKPARSTTREKLLIEHPELVGSGKPEKFIGSTQEHEYLIEFASDSVMTRSIEGKISFWNRRAEELYGWSKEEALGRVSHSLLQTQFPKPLEEIESELVRNGRWEGKLVHTTRDGRRVAVESQWTWDPKKQSGTVVEISRPSSTEAQATARAARR